MFSYLCKLDKPNSRKISFHTFYHHREDSKILFWPLLLEDGIFAVAPMTFPLDESPLNHVDVSMDCLFKRLNCQLGFLIHFLDSNFVYHLILNYFYKTISADMAHYFLLGNGHVVGLHRILRSFVPMGLPYRFRLVEEVHRFMDEFCDCVRCCACLF